MDKINSGGGQVLRQEKKFKEMCLKIRSVEQLSDLLWQSPPGRNFTSSPNS